MKNIEGLNWLRTFAIISIIIAHILLRLGIEETGRYFAYVFVDVFFLLSALLLGLKYGTSKLGKKFFLKRYARLSCTYYPFLVISIIVLLCLGEKVTILNIVSHFTYTNYIIQNQILGVSFGHLWFMSLIMMCYILVTVLSKWKCTKQIFNMPVLLGTILLCVICETICESKHIPGRIILVLSFFSYVFFNANKIFQWINRTNNNVNVIVALALNGVTCILFNIDAIGDSNRVIRDWIVLAAALSWFPLFCKIPVDKRKSRIIDYISTISFEMYLVHHPCVLGKYSLIGPLNTMGGVVAIFIITIVISSLLHNLSKRISNKI